MPFVAFTGSIAETRSLHAALDSPRAWSSKRGSGGHSWARTWGFVCPRLPSRFRRLSSLAVSYFPLIVTAESSIMGCEFLGLEDRDAHGGRFVATPLPVVLLSAPIDLEIFMVI